MTMKTPGGSTVFNTVGTVPATLLQLSGFIQKLEQQVFHRSSNRTVVMVILVMLRKIAVES